MTMSDELEENESLLFNLVYCSRAASLFCAADINQIVLAARQHNARQRVTGWLVYSSGVFFQWLEGGRDEVKSLMARIKVDPRHTDVVILSESEEVRERLFSSWDMEWVSAEDIRAVLLDAVGASNCSESIGSMRLLLKELDSQTIALGK